MQRHFRFAWKRLFVAALVLTALCGYAADPLQKTVRMGFVHPTSPSTASRGISAFWERMHELGYVEGQNLVIEARWAEARYDRLPALMAEVLERKVDVLVTYGAPAAVAAKRATSSVPIVGVAMGDPLRTGLVTSLAQPAGNLTGLSVGWGEGIVGKWLELLQETVPRLATVVVIAIPDNPNHRALIKEFEAIAPRRKLKLRLIEVRDPREIDHAFQQARRTAQAVVMLPDASISAYRVEIAAIAAKHRMPTMHYIRDFVDVGGLIAYAPDYAVQWRQAAEYVDRIVRGAKPADLPIEQPKQYLLVVNLKAARALGLKIPESILLRAELIQ